LKLRPPLLPLGGERPATGSPEGEGPVIPQ